jgi:hypothetical protein
MFSNTAFAHFSLSDLEGTYFMRADRVLGCFQVDRSVIETFDADSADHIRNEIAQDNEMEHVLAQFDFLRSANEIKMEKFQEDLTQSSSISGRSSDGGSGRYRQRIVPLNITSSTVRPPSGATTLSELLVHEASDDVTKAMEEDITLEDKALQEEEEEIEIQLRSEPDERGVRQTEQVAEYKEDDDNMSSITSPSQMHVHVDSIHQDRFTPTPATCALNQSNLLVDHSNSSSRVNSTRTKELSSSSSSSHEDVPQVVASQSLRLEQMSHSQGSITSASSTLTPLQMQPVSFPSLQLPAPPATLFITPPFSSQLTEIDNNREQLWTDVDELTDDESELDGRWL